MNERHEQALENIRNAETTNIDPLNELANIIIGCRRMLEAGNLTLEEVREQIALALEIYGFEDGATFITGAYHISPDSIASLLPVLSSLNITFAEI